MRNELEVRNLSISFRTNNGMVRAVRDISFNLEKGKTLAIVGESGSGKSVTAKAILGILSGNAVVDSGEIIYKEKDLLKFTEEEFHKIRGNEITMIFQDPMSSLDPIMKIGKQMTEATLLNGKTNQKNAKAEFAKYKKLLSEGMKKNGVDQATIKSDFEKFIAFCKDTNKVRKAFEDKCEYTVEGCNDKTPDYYSSFNMPEFVLRVDEALKTMEKDYSADELIQHLFDVDFAIDNKITKEMAYNRAIRIMSDVGIKEPEKRFEQYPFEFSGGMRQRIVIAIAIAANPEVLICDEPTTALDVTIQAQIMELINEIKAKRNISVIFITHDLGVVANMADEVAVMYAGKIVEHGTVDDIFYEPAHPYTWALLSSMPDLDTVDKLESIPGTPPNMIFPPKGDAFAARNKYAMAIDFEEQPPMFKISETHSAATWLLHPNAPKIDPPKAVTDRIARMKKLEEQDNE